MIFQNFKEYRNFNGFRKIYKFSRSTTIKGLTNFLLENIFFRPSKRWMFNRLSLKIKSQKNKNETLSGNNRNQNVLSELLKHDPEFRGCMKKKTCQIAWKILYTSTILSSSTRLLRCKLPHVHAIVQNRLTILCFSFSG